MIGLGVAEIMLSTPAEGEGMESGAPGEGVKPPKSKVNTLQPGPYAEGSIPARGKGRNFTKAEREQMNAIGDESGCHTCGTGNPKTKNGNWILDHQPVSSTVPDGTEQWLFPHCKDCSVRQGGDARQATRN